MGRMAVEERADELQIAEEARADRLARRVAALERQVEARIAQVEDYQRRLAHAENGWKAAEKAAGEAAEVLWKAKEYDALMGTLTMKALRLPRTWYGQARRLVESRTKAR